jgi:hypothetical protein
MKGFFFCYLVAKSTSSGFYVFFSTSGLCLEPLPQFMSMLHKYLKDPGTFGNSLIHFCILSALALWSKRIRKHKLASLYYKVFENN